MSCPHGNWGDCDHCAEVDALFVRLGKLQAERDSLLGACRKAREWLPAAADHPSATAAVYDAIEAVDAAIAKATGGAE